jgi:hypothetical protein
MIEKRIFAIFISLFICNLVHSTQANVERKIEDSDSNIDAAMKQPEDTAIEPINQTGEESAIESTSRGTSRVVKPPPNKQKDVKSLIKNFENSNKKADKYSKTRGGQKNNKNSQINKVKGSIRPTNPIKNQKCDCKKCNCKICSPEECKKEMENGNENVVAKILRKKRQTGCCRGCCCSGGCCSGGSCCAGKCPYASYPSYSSYYPSSYPSGYSSYPSYSYPSYPAASRG